MWVVKYECECIKNMEWFKSYENYIHSKQITGIDSLFPEMVDWIDETMNVSDELWMWVHKNYGMISIIQTLHSTKGLNLLNNEC